MKKGQRKTVVSICGKGIYIKYVYIKTQGVYFAAEVEVDNQTDEEIAQRDFDIPPIKIDIHDNSYNAFMRITRKQYEAGINSPCEPEEYSTIRYDL